MRSNSRNFGIWIGLAILLVAGSTAMAISVASGSGSGVAQPDRPAAQHAASATPGAVENGKGFIFGLDYADQLPETSAAGLSQGVGDAVSTHAGWIRVDLAWYRIQPTPTTWDWGSFDRTVAAAHADGLTVLAIVDQPPAWARMSSCATNQWCPPADDTQFAAFAAKAAQRYPATQVGAFEVWNEENLAAYWPGGPDPAAYTNLLAATATAVRAVRPAAQLVLGGLALAGSDGTTLSPADFLGDAAKDGALHDVSAIGYHPYSFPTMPQNSSAFRAIATGSGSLAAVLDDYGADTPIWITEDGAPVPDAAGDPTAAQPATRSEEQQQAAYATALVRAATSNPRVKALFWFSDIDLPAQHLYFGLRRADGSTRPSFTALGAAIAAYENE
jgi:hypothetical protein